MYDAMLVYNTSGTFIGYAIKEESSPKLQSLAIYSEEEQDDLNLRLSELNRAHEIMAHWPDVRDPDVQALVDDLDFEPYETEETEVLDEENSIIVYGPTEEIDRTASVLVFKTEIIPSKPAEYFARVKRAQETVAKARIP